MSISYLITGGRGFLGECLTQMLSQHNKVISLGRSQANDISCDLSNAVPLLPEGFDVIVHNAGKAHSVPKTLEDKEQFFQVNHKGTINLLSGLDKLNHPPKCLIYISTVAVYGVEKGELLDEQTPLHSTDPYGKSKRSAEEAVIDWGQRNQVKIGILRLPIVVGQKPLGNFYRMIKAIEAGYFFQIGKAPVHRSMVLANDVAKIIPTLVQVGGIYNLTDGQHPTFEELGRVLADKMKVRRPKAIPLWLGKSLAKLGDFGEYFLRRELPFSSNTLLKMTSSLTFSDQLATENLNWRPNLVLNYLNALSRKELI
jgi:GlcNAc-P-P-Und epimerase